MHAIFHLVIILNRAWRISWLRDVLNRKTERLT